MHIHNIFCTITSYDVVVILGNLRLVPPDLVVSHEQSREREDPINIAHQHRLQSYAAEQKVQLQKQQERELQQQEETGHLHVTVTPSDDIIDKRKQRRQRKKSLPKVC